MPVCHSLGAAGAAEHVPASRGQERVGAPFKEPLPRCSCRLGGFCGFVELLGTVTHSSSRGAGTRRFRRCHSLAKVATGMK